MQKKSRQQLWQEKQKKEGKCCICNEPLFTKWHCKEHTKIQRDKARARYRNKKGLDVNAPITETGRKRIEGVE
jgi:hypothetical protein